MDGFFGIRTDKIPVGQFKRALRLFAAFPVVFAAYEQTTGLNYCRLNCGNFLILVGESRNRNRQMS
jgi:hypothetical protein